MKQIFILAYAIISTAYNTQNKILFMKNNVLSIFMLLLSITSYAQVTTYFYGRDKIQSKKETAALYSVSMHDYLTWVTVELTPTKDRSRMNYWTSKNTYIIVGNGIELPIVGFENDNHQLFLEPFSGNWGWSNVKKDQKYYYTMVFGGIIPPGVTKFTLVDRGNNNGAHGYGFSNYTLNNPRIGTTSWSESSVKQNIDNNNDGICGIYEGTDDIGCKIGCVKQNGNYTLIYLGRRSPVDWWQIGDIKAILRSSATNGLFKADWYMLDKSKESDCYLVFDGGSMKVIVNNKESLFLKMYPTSSANSNPSSNSRPSSSTEEWSGTGFALNNGYIATNYHVVDNAKSIKVQGIKGDFNIKYNATVVASDKFNDLAIVKINDSRFNGFGTIPYRVKTSTSEVGEDVFVLGYPLTTTMGDEIKLTTGVISSKTGFQGDVALYQISAPIQPGNSGGPLFDGKGNLIGIVNAKHMEAENVGYAIKTSYLNNLVETSSSTSLLPTNNSISGMSLSNKVKSLKNFVFMIKCSNSSTTGSVSTGNISSASHMINYPSVRSSTAKGLTIRSVRWEHDYTAVEIISNGMTENGYYQWCSIDRNAYIMVDGKRYTMTKAENIEIAPEKTYYSYPGQEIIFTLYFPAIPSSATSMDLIESPNSDWKFYGIKIR